MTQSTSLNDSFEHEYDADKLEKELEAEFFQEPAPQKRGRPSKIKATEPEPDCIFNHKGTPDENIATMMAHLERRYRPRIIQGSLSYLAVDEDQQAKTYTKSSDAKAAMTDMLRGVGACSKCFSKGAYKDVGVERLRARYEYKGRTDILPFVYRRPSDNHICVIDFTSDSPVIREAVPDDLIIAAPPKGFRSERDGNDLEIDQIPVLDLEPRKDDPLPLIVTKTFDEVMGLDPDDVQYLADFIVSAMNMRHQHDQIGYFKSASGTGKNTFMDVLKKMFGGNIVTAKHYAGTGPFGLAIFERKMLGIFNEANPSDKDVNAVVGSTNSQITINQKNVPEYQSRLGCKYIMFSTKSPDGGWGNEPIDWDRGLMRRLRLITTNARRPKVDDPSIKIRSKSDEEVSRFVRWVLRVGDPEGVFRVTNAMMREMDTLILEQDPFVAGAKMILAPSELPGATVELSDLRDEIREQIVGDKEWGKRLDPLRSAVTAQGYELQRVSARKQDIMGVKIQSIDDYFARYVEASPERVEEAARESEVSSTPKPGESIYGDEPAQPSVPRWEDGSDEVLDDFEPECNECGEPGRWMPPDKTECYCQVHWPKEVR